MYRGVRFFMLMKISAVVFILAVMINGCSHKNSGAITGNLLNNETDLNNNNNNDNNNNNNNNNSDNTGIVHDTDTINRVKKTPGNLSLRYLKREAPCQHASNITSGPEVLTFELGDIRGSRKFSFLLLNSGGTPVTDIKLISSNSKFLVSPARIDVLEPGMSAQVLPVIDVIAVHGTVLEGIGNTELMDRGTNETLLTISGLTSGEDSSEIKLEKAFTLRVFARVASFRLFNGEQEIDMTKKGIVKGDFCDYFPDRPRDMEKPSCWYYYATEPAIMNDGNTPITVTAFVTTWDNDGTLPVFETRDLAPARIIEKVKLMPGEKHFFPPEYDSPPWDFPVILIRIETDNTVVDFTKFNVLSDGCIYAATTNETF